MKVGIVGCGNLGTSLLNGLREAMPELEIWASKRRIEDLQDLASPQVHLTSDNRELLAACDVILLCLKPYNLLSFVEEHQSLLDAQRHTLVSCATGISIQSIAEAGGHKVGIYRAMPNTAASVNESLTALSSKADPLQRKEEIAGLFRAIGEVIFIEEQLMESATILGACGVAYVLRFMRAMIQGGIEIGFDAQTATAIVSQTMKGAAELIIQHGSHPEQEIDKVTTPKGCTIVGLNEMEHAGFSSALIKGIVASYEKIS
jgi:pyrroline-5-carboxylate reductase